MILIELNQLSAATHISETKIAAEKLRQVEISVPRIKFFLNQLAEGKMDDKHYKRYLVNIFVNKIYVFDDGHCTAFFNTQKDPVAVDINLFKAVEKSFETCSSVTQYGSPLRHSFPIRNAMPFSLCLNKLLLKNVLWLVLSRAARR